MEGLRPLGVGEVIDAAIRIYRSRIKTLLLSVAIPVVPVLILTTFVTFSSQPDLTVDPVTGEPNFNGGDFALFLAAQGVNFVATIVATSVATAACFRSISGAYVGDDPDWRESLRFVRSRLGSVLGLTFLTILITLLGFLACGVGLLWVIAVFAVAMPALLVEGLGATKALGRSRALVRGTFWRVLGIVLLSSLLAGVFQAVLSAPVFVLALVDVSDAVQQVVGGFFTMVATVLVVPFSAALTMALYVDLRVRKEGFDLVLWAQRLGNAPTSGFPAQPGAPANGPIAGGWAPVAGSTLPPPPGSGSALPPPPPSPSGGWGPPPTGG